MYSYQSHTWAGEWENARLFVPPYHVMLVLSHVVISMNVGGGRQWEYVQFMLFKIIYNYYIYKILNKREL